MRIRRVEGFYLKQVKTQRYPKEFETCYSVHTHPPGDPIAYVWSIRRLSYRGMQGWNRGIRLKDFHPKTWEWGWKREDVGQSSRSHLAYNLTYAVMNIRDEWKKDVKERRP